MKVSPILAISALESRRIHLIVKRGWEKDMDEWIWRKVAPMACAVLKEWSDDRTIVVDFKFSISSRPTSSFKNEITADIIIASCFMEGKQMLVNNKTKSLHRQWHVLLYLKVCQSMTQTGFAECLIQSKVKLLPDRIGNILRLGQYLSRRFVLGCLLWRFHKTQIHHQSWLQDLRRHMMNHFLEFVKFQHPCKKMRSEQLISRMQKENQNIIFGWKHPYNDVQTYWMMAQTALEYLSRCSLSGFRHEVDYMCRHLLSCKGAILQLTERSSLCGCTDHLGRCKC